MTPTAFFCKDDDDLNDGIDDGIDDDVDDVDDASTKSHFLELYENNPEMVTRSRKWKKMPRMLNVSFLFFHF